MAAFIKLNGRVNRTANKSAEKKKNGQQTQIKQQCTIFWNSKTEREREWERERREQENSTEHVKKDKHVSHNSVVKEETAIRCSIKKIPGGNLQYLEATMENFMHGIVRVSKC